MKPMKFLVPALVLVLAVAGCILVSGQFLIDFELPSFVTVTNSTISKQNVDLNTNDDYDEHKDDLKAIADIAVLGKLTNNGSNAIGVEVWMTATDTNLADEAAVRAGAIRLWGPFNVAAGPGTSETVDWNESATLFNAAGKTALLNEVKGDGQFTLYAIGNDTTYNVSVENGVLALVLDFGK